MNTNNISLVANQIKSIQFPVNFTVLSAVVDEIIAWQDNQILNQLDSSDELINWNNISSIINSKGFQTTSKDCQMLWYYAAYGINQVDGCKLRHYNFYNDYAYYQPAEAIERYQKPVIKEYETVLYTDSNNSKVKGKCTESLAIRSNNSEKFNIIQFENATDKPVNYNPSLVYAGRSYPFPFHDSEIIHKSITEVIDNPISVTSTLLVNNPNLESKHKIVQNTISIPTANKSNKRKQTKKSVPKLFYIKQVINAKRRNNDLSNPHLYQTITSNNIISNNNIKSSTSNIPAGLPNSINKSYNNSSTLINNSNINKSINNTSNPTNNNVTAMNKPAYKKPRVVVNTKPMVSTNTLSTQILYQMHNPLMNINQINQNQMYKVNTNVNYPNMSVNQALQNHLQSNTSNLSMLQSANNQSNVMNNQLNKDKKIKSNETAQQTNRIINTQVTINPLINNRLNQLTPNNHMYYNSNPSVTSVYSQLARYPGHPSMSSYHVPEYFSDPNAPNTVKANEDKRIVNNISTSNNINTISTSNNKKL